MNCPECGSPVAPGAAVCARCGFPLRKDALSRAASGGGPDVSTLFGWAVAAVGVGLLAAFALSMLSRVPLPRWAMTRQQAAEKDGEALLERAWTLQNAYFANHHRYATSFGELKTVGWTEPRAQPYWLQIARADSGKLCLEAIPRVDGTHARFLRVGERGRVERERSCGDRAEGVERTEWDALRLLADVSAGIEGWKDANGGRPPATEAELADAYDSSTDPDFRMGLSPAAAKGAFCLFIALRTPAAAPVLFSLDGDAIVHRGDGCTGERVRRFGIDLPANP